MYSEISKALLLMISWHGIRCLGPYGPPSLHHDSCGGPLLPGPPEYLVSLIDDLLEADVGLCRPVDDLLSCGRRMDRGVLHIKSQSLSRVKDVPRHREWLVR
jgi:hypothetical protein